METPPSLHAILHAQQLKEAAVQGRKPFTLIAAIIFGLMALLHVYRLFTDFQVIVGTHTIPYNVSWIALVITGGLSWMLFKESRS